MRSMEERLERLRGKLKPEEPGARGLEKVARNPECTRLKALTIAGISPLTAATKIYGEPAREGQSPFALAIGLSFEKRLYANGAAALLELYRAAGRLSPDECKVVIIPDHAPGKSPGDMARRRAETLRLLKLKLAGDPNAPNLIIQPRLSVSLLDLEHDIEPDALVASDNETFYRPVEVKSYPDRRGKTDPVDVRSACRQAAVGVVGLRHLVSRLGEDPDKRVSPWGDLVLRVPGKGQGSLTPMLLKQEVASIERSLEEAPRSLGELEEMLEPGATLDDRKTLESIPNHYRESCREHCALAGCCKQEAVHASDPILLGSIARERLAACGTLHRALELMRGKGAPPRTPEEKALADRLKEVLFEYQRAADGR